MTRIEQFFAELREEGLSDYEIAAGLGNGDIERPEWMAISESTDHVKAWDNDDAASAQMNFIYVSYD